MSRVAIQRLQSLRHERHRAGVGFGALAPVALLIALGCAGTSGEAPLRSGAFRVEGAVRDAAGQVIEDTQVFIADQSAGALTDERGRYHLDLPAPGSYLVKAVRVDFTRDSLTIDVQGHVMGGYSAGSTALLGFGVDALIKSSSGAAVLWRLQHADRQAERELPTLRLVGASLILLAIYIGFEAIRSLLEHAAPGVSIVGVAVAITSLIVMPLACTSEAPSRTRAQKWRPAR